MAINEFGMLKKTMEDGKSAVQAVWIMPCPLARAGVPEATCAACRFRCSLVECPDTRRPTPEEICDKCFREKPKERMCRYAKARRGEIDPKKIKRFPACGYPKKLTPQLVAWPVGAALQQMGNMVLVPKDAPPPPDFLPRLRWNPVTQATELAAEEEETPDNG